jgi:phytoene dehydrogenase-like protein
MEKFDDIVVGSGASGLTMTQLLALSGRRVLLIEKGDVLGGSLARFRRQGIPCDTGFHFTAGLGGDNPMLLDMLDVLHIKEAIKPLFISSKFGNRVIFGDSNFVCELPAGIQSLMEQLCEKFPHEKQGIIDFFELAKIICDQTPLFDIRNIIDDIPIMQHAIDEDFIPLDEYLDEHIKDDNLKGIITSYSMCYGVSPKKVSLANHCRICFWLFDSIARVERGGDAFIDAFKLEFEKYDVTIENGVI